MIQKNTSAKALLLAVIIFSNFFIANAQSNCRWANGYGGTAEDDGNAVAIDPSGNIYTTGSFFSSPLKFGAISLPNTSGAAEVFIVKQDSCGNVKWAKSAGGDANDEGLAIAADKFGNVYVTGIAHSSTITFGTVVLTNNGTTNAFLVKYNPAGNVAWAKITTGTGDAIPTGLGTDPNGNIFVGGYFDDVLNFGTKQVTNIGLNNVFIAKYDSTGNTIWANSAGYANDDDEISGISADGSGNVYITGTYNDSISFGSTKIIASSGGADIFLAKYNSTGAVVWAKTAATASNYGGSASTDPAGNVFISGIFSTSSVSFGSITLLDTIGGGNGNGFLVKYNSGGTALWGKTLGGQYDPMTNLVCTDASGNVYVGGGFTSSSVNAGPFSLTNFSNGDTTEDIFIAKYDGNGNIKWAKSAGGALDDFMNGMAISPSGNPVVYGTYYSPAMAFGNTTITNNGDADVFLSNDITQNNMITPQICEVTVDSLSQHNVIYWDRTINPEAKSYVVLRETSANVYQPLAIIPNDSLSLFTDTVQAKYFPNTGDPNAGTYRYKIQVIDTTGNYSLLSPYHNTIYIIDNGSGTFSWQGYTIEPTTNPVSNYILRRDDLGNGQWAVIQSVAGTQFSVTDSKYSTFPKGRWRIETQWSLSCTPTYRLAQANAVNTSRSNIKNNIATAGIKTYDASALISVYPNPAGNNLTIECPEWINDNTAFVVIENYLGMEVMKFVPAKSQSKILLDMSGLASGIYCVEVRGTDFTALKKIIVNH